MLEQASQLNSKRDWDPRLMHLGTDTPQTRSPGVVGGAAAALASAFAILQLELADLFDLLFETRSMQWS